MTSNVCHNFCIYRTKEHRSLLLFSVIMSHSVLSGTTVLEARPKVEDQDWDQDQSCKTKTKTEAEAGLVIRPRSQTPRLSASNKDQFPRHSVSWHQLSGTFCLQLRTVPLPSPLSRHIWKLNSSLLHTTRSNIFFCRQRLWFELFDTRRRVNYKCFWQWHCLCGTVCRTIFELITQSY